MTAYYHDNETDRGYFYGYYLLNIGTWTKNTEGINFWEFSNEYNSMERRQRATICYTRGCMYVCVYASVQE